MRLRPFLTRQELIAGDEKDDDSGDRQRVGTIFSKRRDLLFLSQILVDFAKNVSQTYLLPPGPHPQIGEAPLLQAFCLRFNGRWRFNGRSLHAAPAPGLRLFGKA